MYMRCSTWFGTCKKARSPAQPLQTRAIIRRRVLQPVQSRDDLLRDHLQLLLSVHRQDVYFIGLRSLYRLQLGTHHTALHVLPSPFTHSPDQHLLASLQRDKNSLDRTRGSLVVHAGENMPESVTIRSSKRGAYQNDISSITPGSCCLLAAPNLSLGNVQQTSSRALVTAKERFQALERSLLLCSSRSSDSSSW